jgi:hypothetical protein
MQRDASPPTSSAAALRACIHRCATRTDGRARWPAQQRCAQALAGEGAAPSVIDQASAAAARRVGEAIATIWARNGR